MSKGARNIDKTIFWRAGILFTCLFIFAIAVLGKAIHLQAVEGEALQIQFEEKNIALRNIKATRGNIYAADGSLLSTSIPIYDLYFDTKADGLTDEIFNQKVDSLSLALSTLIKEKTKEQISNQLKIAKRKGRRYQLIKRNVKYAELQQIKTFPIFNRGRYKGGLIIERKNKRERPFRTLAARSIGYMKDSTGVGLERAYDKTLAGIEGKRVMKRLSGGIWMPLNEGNEIDPQDGYDIKTTIDINLQDVASQALLAQLSTHNADHGCVVLMEVQTGDIKAIANLKRNSNDTYGESYNYAIGESTEPGSTFKLASIAVALEDGLVKPSDSVDTKQGRMKFHTEVMKDSRYGGYGKITIQRAIEVSSNIGIAKTIQENYAKHPQKFIDGLYRMNLNTPLGIEIPGEGKPYIKSTDDDWSGISLPWISHGYEVSMTPLQILTFYNAIANNGKMVKPRFVTSIYDKDKLIESYDTKVINPKICSRKTIDQLKVMLEGVVIRGTATNLKNSYFNIAGKTGTAQIYNAKYGYKYASKVSYQASFVGYFPAENPKYSCIVVVNAPSNDVYYGNLVAGPIFKEVADKVYATSVEIHPEIIQNSGEKITPTTFTAFGEDLEKLNEITGIPQIEIPLKHQLAKITDAKVKTQSTIENLVPNVTGLTLKDAVFMLESRGLIVSFSGKGKVKSQSINAGTRIVKGSTVFIELI